MRHKIKKLLLGVALVAAACGTVLPVRAADTDVTITTPTEGQSIIQSNAQVIGTAPAGVLVDIDISDIDTNQTLFVHQQFGELEGSVTSDQNGHWAFTPQQQLVPGQFTVVASYTSPTNQKITSKTIKFVVIATDGSSMWLSPTVINALLIAGGVVLLLIIWLIVHLARRKRKWHSSNELTPQDTKQEQPRSSPDGDEPEQSLFLKTGAGRAAMESLETEAQKIEEELSRTAEELERTNSAVLKLHKAIHDQEADKPDPSETRGARGAKP